LTPQPYDYMQTKDSLPDQAEMRKSCERGAHISTTINQLHNMTSLRSSIFVMHLKATAHERRTPLYFCLDNYPQLSLCMYGPSGGRQGYPMCPTPPHISQANNILEPDQFRCDIVNNSFYSYASVN
jgi:hypothetical protein